MRNIEVFGIDCFGSNHSGPWGVAVTDYPSSYRFKELFAPVFQERFPADVFAEVMQVHGLDEKPGYESTELELKLAREIEEFIAGWDEAHGDDNTYPTPDGRYPSWRLMAGWFLESRKTNATQGD